MELGTDDKKWITKAIIKGVVDGINQVMIPYSEEQEKRFKKEFVEVRNDIARVERKLDTVTDHQAEKLDDHGKRIVRLELLSS